MIDGKMETAEWQGASLADSFINKWPTDTGKARLQTEISILYDESFIYFGIKAYYSGKDLVIQSLKRDINPYYSDGVSIVLDPSNKSVSGYTFGVNAGGAQMEGIVQVNSDSFEWDAKWYSASRKEKEYWTAELAIPFKSFRFPKNQTQWGINFIRNDMSNNCFSTWNRVPIQFFGANLNCLGKISFADGMPEIKSNHSFIPYLSAKLDQADHAVAGPSLNAGLDAKVAIGTSMNLDATINPDFSQVDVDNQIINLDRFNVLLPEKRTFFLENSDLFTNIGLQGTAVPFVSRKIGLAADGTLIPIIAGLRLTGNANPALRVGLMNIQTTGKSGLLPQNYTVAAFDQKILNHSNIRGIFTNRQQIAGEEKSAPDQSFNRVAGSELSLLSNNSKFSGRAGYFQSFNPGSISDGMGYAMAGFTNKNIDASAGWNFIHSNFIADLGFTPRLYNYDASKDTTIRIGYNNYNTNFNYFIYPKSKKTINSIQLNAATNHYFAQDNRFLEFDATVGTDFLFANRSEAQLIWNKQSVDLPFPTSIFSETGPIAKGRYDFNFIRLMYNSNFLKPFSWGLILDQGGYYNGTRTSVTGNLKYRRQPWGNFGINFTYNDIELNNIHIHPYIISPTLEFAFNNNLFWTIFLQYNTEIKNFNVNSRIQWRFKPMSDIFLVYTDNYFTDGLLSKSRSLVFKISYWIN
ncbi:MAG: DUF5916 domain-containing protein [Chitinophagales bacterium]